MARIHPGQPFLEVKADERAVAGWKPDGAAIAACGACPLTSASSRKHCSDVISSAGRSLADRRTDIAEKAGQNRPGALHQAPVAQQIRASGFEPAGRGCNSYRERHFSRRSPTSRGTELKTRQVRVRISPRVPMEREPDKRTGIP